MEKSLQKNNYENTHVHLLWIYFFLKKIKNGRPGSPQTAMAFNLATLPAIWTRVMLLGRSGARSENPCCGFDLPWLVQRPKPL